MLGKDLQQGQRTKTLTVFDPILQQPYPTPRQAAPAAVTYVVAYCTSP